MAAVTLTGTSSGLTATIHYNYDGAGPRPRAFALRIQTSAGTISAVNKIKSVDGVSTAASPGYGVFPGTIDIDTEGNVTTYGSPVEPATLPGSGGTGIGTNAVVIAMGSLYKGDPNKPLNAANLVSVTVAGTTTATLTITPETTYRKGIVGEGGIIIDATPNPLTIPVNGGCGECVKSTAPFYADWVAFGKPSCWCYYRQCKGDADGLKQGTALVGYTYVYTNDLSIMTGPIEKCYGVKEPPKGSGIRGNCICADFDHAKQGTTLTGYMRVYTNDLTILINNYNKKEPPKGSGVMPCDSTYYNCQFDPGI